MDSFSEFRQSFQEWSPKVAQRWWSMLNVSLSFLPLAVGIVTYIIWTRDVQPPLPVWNIVLLTAGAFLFLITSFLAFHQVRKKRDEVRKKLIEKENRIADLEKRIAEEIKFKSDLRIGAKLDSIETFGYYDKAFGRHDVKSDLTEGNKLLKIDIVLSPAKPMTLDTLALELWGKKFYTEKLPEKVIKETSSYKMLFIVPKELAIDTKEARIYALAGNSDYYSDLFSIVYGG